MSGHLLDAWALLGFVAIPGDVIWSYSVAGVVLAVGLAGLFLRGDWQRARGLDKLILFGPLFYVMPLAAFGTEHFTRVHDIASLIPKWIPGHLFWAYFVGACFIAASLSLVTGVQARLAASLLALNFFLFVALMDAPVWVHHPSNRIIAALMLRELSFSGGPLALAASLMEPSRERAARILATVARYFVAIPVLFYSLEQFLHADCVPGVPLQRATPDYIPGHMMWAYLAAAIYAVGGVLLLVGKKTRVAAAGVGLAVLVVELAVYLPIGVADRASLDNGLNYVFDTLMFCGTVLLLARAMPREAPQHESGMRTAETISTPA
jgi:uncharacterized membrane protein YphA (DoxX/SURF4 family)